VPSHKPAAPGKSLMTRRICGPSWAASFAIVTVGSAALLRVLSVAAQRIEVSRSIVPRLLDEESSVSMLWCQGQVRS
jgi:hypothetical protein